tara:strand:+ start:24138 stop:24374 length:237 start_codon:yes stop_codon:yes gene_type:complete
MTVNKHYFYLKSTTRNNPKSIKTKTKDEKNPSNNMESFKYKAIKKLIYLRAINKFNPSTLISYINPFTSITSTQWTPA